MNAYTGPDGSLMIVDMYHGLIQHKAYVTTYLRKQYISRGLDKQNNHAGRIYRVRWSENPASELPQLEGLAPTKLVPYLAHPNGFWRDTAQRLIVETGDASVVPQINTLAKDHTKPLGQIHALWTLEGLNAVNNEAVQTTLRSSNRDVLITALEMAPLANHATEILEACIQVPDTHYVHKARCLTRLGLAQAWEHLLPILQSPIEKDLLTNVLFKAAGEKLPEFIHFLDSQSIPTAREMAVLLTQAIKKHEARTKGVANNLKGSALEAFVNGKSIYEGKAVCMGCHGQDGAGLLNLGPPLAQSEWVTGDPKRLIQILLHGLQGPIEVAGKTYNPQAVMPGLAANPTISDKDLAHVITYIRNAWGNKASVVPQTMVEEQRKLTASRGNKLYSAEDFQ